MKFITILVVLLGGWTATAQYRGNVVATAPQGHGRYVVVPQEGPVYAPGYAPAPGYAAPDGNNGYPQRPPSRPPAYGGEHYQPRPGLDGLKQACAGWENHPERRTGQLADLKVKIICRQVFAIVARVETKTMPAYEVKSAPQEDGQPWVKEMTCQQIAQAQYDIVQICMQQQGYPQPAK